MSAAARWLVRRRYDWTQGTGAWATWRGRWDSRPGRAYVRELRWPEPVIAYHGLPEGPRYALPHLFGQHGGDGHRRLAPARWPALAGAAHADLLIVGCSPRQARRLPADRSLILPFRINLVIDIDPDHDVMLRRVSGNERRQFAKLRRQFDWAWERSTSVADLAWFFERMHLPTMALRHGEVTRGCDYATAEECLFRRGHLFFVTEGDKRVAGVLCRVDERNRSMTMRLLGVLDGDETHYRSGAVKAVYYLAIEWACANGIRRLDLSGGEPFPGTGVFQFKRRFHPTVELPGDHFAGKRLWLGVQRDTPAVRDLLVSTPMFAITRDGGLEAVYFTDAERPPRTGVRAEAPGVSAVRTVDLDTFLAPDAPSPARAAPPRVGPPLSGH
jgi:hypothetical protein